MRIIGGSLGGRRLNPPLTKWPTRPTTDRAKEALFNILQNKVDFEKISVCDLFAGTGNLSFEAFSRGVADITLVERYRPAIKFIQSQISAFEASDAMQVKAHDVFRFIKTSEKQYDLILADPPYALKSIKELPDLIFKYNLLKKNGLLVIEHDATVSFAEHPKVIDYRNYGQSIFSFFG